MLGLQGVVVKCTVAIFFPTVDCMLRPLRKANSETRRVLNKVLKTEAHSPLCELYNFIEWFRQGKREIQGETRHMTKE